MFQGRAVGTIICGGNIDARILANVMLRNLLRDGRLVRLVLEIPDRPGVLADIAGRIGTAAMRRAAHCAVRCARGTALCTACAGAQRATQRAVLRA
jgi:hypothetical protein